MGIGRTRRGAVRLVTLAAAVCALTMAPAAARAFMPRDFENPQSANTSQQFGLNSVQRHDTPNDPKYDYAEPDDEDSPTATPPGALAPSSNIFDEDFGYFGFPSSRSGSALYTDPDHLALCLAQAAAPCRQVSGFNASGAWKLERGRPDVTVAILDTGIKWDRN